MTFKWILKVIGYKGGAWNHLQGQESISSVEVDEPSDTISFVKSLYRQNIWLQLNSWNMIVTFHE